MCLKHSKYCIRTTFSLLVNDPEKYAKQLQKMIQKPTKFHQKSVLVATKTESRKQSAKMYQKISKNVENGPPNGDPFWDTFWPSGPSLLSQASLGSQNDSQGLPESPRDQSKPQFSPIFGGMGGFCDDFSCHVGYFLLVCLVSFFGYLEAYFRKS